MGVAMEVEKQYLTKWVNTHTPTHASGEDYTFLKEAVSTHIMYLHHFDHSLAEEGRGAFFWV